MGMGSSDTYTYDLERPPLESIHAYYRRKHEELIANNSTTAYLIKTEKTPEEGNSRDLEYLTTQQLSHTSAGIWRRRFCKRYKWPCLRRRAAGAVSSG